MEPKFEELKNCLYEIHDLTQAAAVLHWDERVMMPVKGAAVRAEQLATLQKVAHQKLTCDEMGKLLEDLRPYEQSLPYESDDASLIRVARSDYEKAVQVPGELQAEMTRVSANANPVWVAARAKGDFSIFQPVLEKQLELKHRYIACFPPTQDPYDVLLNDFEKGRTTAEVKVIFEALKQGLVPLIAGANAKTSRVSDALLRGHFPPARQLEFCLKIIRRFGFDLDSWRLDPTVHPFTSGSGIQDIRISTRYYEDHLGPALWGSMHECGHGLYESGVDLNLERTILARGASFAIHESQSRLWENLVGRSRAFWKYFYPMLKDTYPEHFINASSEDFYRSMNTIKPSFIRVEADEATYGLHIILRFELEQAMLNGEVAVKDVPEAWNARFKEYMGIAVPNNSLGVLQDIHWSSGQFGYFPTYQLGNIISVQVWEKVLQAIPDLYERFEQGDFLTLREWLRENLHRYGRKFTPKETLEKVVGTSEIRVEPYLRYMNEKFGAIYGLN